MHTAADLSPAQAMLIASRLIAWGAAGLLAYGVADWAMARPAFALKNLTVTTPVAHVTETQLRLVAEREIRGTFFTVDLARIQTSLEQLPWVAQARVERRWPDTLAVQLVEHQPLARWNDGALVSPEGRVFVAAVDRKLPRFVGPDARAAEVVAAYARFGKTLAPLSQPVQALALSPRGAWEIRLANGTQIKLGRTDTEARLARFVALYPRLFPAPSAPSPAQSATAGHAATELAAASQDASASLAPRVVDLRYPDGFAVRPAPQHSLFLAAQPAAAPATPSTP
jgi:cell division protein FtsQ